MTNGSRGGGGFRERTDLTNKAELARMIARAVAGGHLHRLYWFVQIKIPGSRTRSGRAEIVAASWPKDHIPVVPMGDDPEVSRCWAELVKAMFEDGNRGSGIEHALCLTDRETLAGADWYEWGQEFDCVCETCGAVFRDTAANAGYSCCGGWRE